ncbi:S8 family serine peptidase [Cyanobacteria bacterium FACHB-63]|nr:S8 family serine peptidase [Cyanobacteria bacterium FACHB-63]
MDEKFQDPMSKLSPNLVAEFGFWRTQSSSRPESAALETSARAVESSSSSEKKRVVVGVIHDGDVEVLREAGLQAGFDFNGRVTGSIAFEDLERLASVPSVVHIEKIPESHPALDGTVAEMRVPWKVPPTAPWPGKGAGVIVAIIDTGIDIFHDSFKKTATTTRILELWDQAASTGGSLPPAAFQQIGRVYSAAEINAGLAAGPPFHSVDKNGHGTHVAGIAVGNGRQDDRCSFPGRYVGVAPEAELVIVKAIDLPEGAQSNVDDALMWCAQAGTRHGNKPVVINCSFGSSSGPHDGTAWRDNTLESILRPAGSVPPGLAIVCAAGNDGDNEIHENGIITANGSATVSFTIPEGSMKQDYLDIWYNGTSTLNLTLTAPPNPGLPGSKSIGPIAPGAAGSPFTIGGMTIAVGSSTAPIPIYNNQKNISVSITAARTQLSSAINATVVSITVASAAGFPTSGNYQIKIGSEQLTVTAGQGTTTWTVMRGVNGTTAAAHPNNTDVERSDVVIRPGQWQFTLQETAGVEAKWRAWFETGLSGDPHPTFRLPSESDIVERRRFDTINSPGSALTAITVANYSDDNGLINDSSSRGKQTMPAQVTWQPSHVYSVGNHVIPTGAQTGFRYRCITAGTSGAAEPVWPNTLGQNVVDGAVQWKAVGALVHELKPTVAAPGTGVRAPRSRDDKPEPSSCCDQLVVDKDGTSMSAPHITGLIALMFEKNRNLTFEQVRGHLQRTTRVEGIPGTEVPPIFDPLLNIRASSIWGAGKANAAAVLADIPAAAGGSSGGGGSFSIEEPEWGYTPHTIYSRLGEWRSRFGPRPGLMLMAALISEHFDQVLRLVNNNSRVAAVWRHQGGPLLVRHLLVSHPTGLIVMPAVVDGHDVSLLLQRFLWILKRFGNSNLQLDIDHYGSFIKFWPGGDLQLLDQKALELKRQ